MSDRFDSADSASRSAVQGSAMKFSKLAIFTGIIGWVSLIVQQLYEDPPFDFFLDPPLDPRILYPFLGLLFLPLILASISIVLALIGTVKREFNWWLAIAWLLPVSIFVKYAVLYNFVW